MFWNLGIKLLVVIALFYTIAAKEKDLDVEKRQTVCDGKFYEMSSNELILKEILLGLQLR